MYLYSRSSNRNPESQAKAVPVQSLQILSDVMNNIGFRGTRVYGHILLDKTVDFIGGKHCNTNKSFK